MESASCKAVATLEKPPISGDEKYQGFLSELRSYCCGYWKWLRKPRIREVFVVGSVTNPETGKIDKLRIKRKTRDFIELADCRRFDIKTGRSLYGDPKCIFPVEDRLVWDAWEPHSLRQHLNELLRLVDFDQHRHAVILGRQKDQAFAVGPIHPDLLAVSGPEPPGVIVRIRKAVGSAYRPPIRILTDVHGANAVHGNGVRHQRNRIILVQNRYDFRLSKRKALL